jgi:hypothetical protein
MKSFASPKREALQILAEKPHFWKKQNAVSLLCLVFYLPGVMLCTLHSQLSVSQQGI